MNCFLELFVVILASSLMVKSERIPINEFNAAVTDNGFKLPPHEYYNYFVDDASKYTKDEQAMLLAQIIHESDGFQYTDELVCLTGNHCAGSYADRYSLPGRTYYGRGFIQLTWSGNYRAASLALGLGDRLLQDPELVSRDKSISMRVSIWYWDAVVHPALRGRENQFGITTSVINPVECHSGYNPRAQRRWSIYLKVADALKIVNKARENGCYN